MRLAAFFAIIALPLASAAQENKDKDKGTEDPNRTRVELTGCVKGSTLTETNLRMSPAVREEVSTRRWRLRGSKTLMRQLKEHTGKELEVVGTTKNPQSGMVVGSTRIGKTNIYIGGNTDRNARDPLPEIPTIDVESFEPTGETCR